MAEAGTSGGSFGMFTDADIRDLVAAYPLAWIVSGGTFAASPMPMLLDVDAEGRPVSLTGHFPRANPQFAMLQKNPQALFLFQGPHAYVSPALLAQKSWAPTWNFAIVRVVADIVFDEGLTDEALERIVNHMEAGRPQPWTVAALGERYERLRKGVLGFRAPIRSLTARFKLGQDERPEVLAEILEGIGNDPLADWMTRFNARSRAG